MNSKTKKELKGIINEITNELTKTKEVKETITNNFFFNFLTFNLNKLNDELVEKLIEETEEVFKPVAEYPTYLVSNKGKVLCTNYRSWGITKELKLKKDKDGYLTVHFRVGENNEQKQFKVHRLVAKAFIDNPEDKETVNHINGIKSDNRVSNLEWNTIKENIQHAFRTGLNKGRKNCKNKNKRVK